MDVHDHGLAQALCKPVGNADDARLLQRHHVLEILREVLEESLFGGPGIADHRGDPELSQDVEGHVLDGAHLSSTE